MGSEQPLLPPGPGANLWYNLMETKRSMECVVELQVNHTKHLWQASTAPLRQVMDELVVRRDLRQWVLGGWGSGIKPLLVSLCRGARRRSTPRCRTSRKPLWS